MNNNLIIDVKDCARCGQNHEQMEAKPFTNPVNDTDGAPWTHWFLCPVTGEPVLVQQIYRLVEYPDDQN